MAEVDIAPDFAAELKDGFKLVNSWMSNGIAWLDDIQSFYRERSAIEKEYSQKLNGLAKKYFERKAKKSSSLSVGDTPTVTPGSLESASMTTWGVQLTTLESRATQHEEFSTYLINSLAEPLKNLGARYEDLRKQHSEYASKLEKERDSNYSDLKKTKAKYDGVCQEVETRRKKTESGFDHGKNKAQAAFNQQQLEMRNMKNTYLIAINVSNKQKERYYHEYVPELLESMQALSEAKTSTLNNLWMTAARSETQMLTHSTQLVEHLSAEIPRNNPLLDSMMFLRHNVGNWQDPQDFVFEPSPVWLDDDVMASDPASKTFLMNVLTKSKSSIGELTRECEAYRREVEGAKRVRQAIREGRDQRDELEVVRAQFHHQETLHDAERKRTTAEVEVSTITTAVGDATVGARNHRFKNETFRLPTNCDLCGDRIWGLSAKGLSCEDCGFTCHTKCELKVPPECPGELNKDQRKAIKAERQAMASAQVANPPTVTNDSLDVGRPSALQRSDTMGSMNTLSSGYATSAHRSVSGTTPQTSFDGPDATPAPPPTGNTRRIMAPPPASYSRPDLESGVDDQPPGRMLYAYQATGEGEISVSEGQAFAVLEPDDGSGWIKIKPTSFGALAGLVPASYAELTGPGLPMRPAATTSGSTTQSDVDNAATAPRKKQGPAVAPRRGAKKVKHVEALYVYNASNEGEVSMEEGERMVLVMPDQGDGWCEVDAKAGRGVVPSSWVKEV